MEIFENEFNVTFTNAAAARKAKQIADESFRSLQYAYKRYEPGILAANSLTIEEKTILTFEEICFDSSDLLDASNAVIKAIAYGMKDEDFEFSVWGSDTYTESSLEGKYHNRVLEITSIYYPAGYCEYLECTECEEEIVSVEDYDPNKTYICPVCGEELDFSDSAPVTEKELITIS